MELCGKVGLGNLGVLAPPIGEREQRVGLGGMRVGEALEPQRARRVIVGADGAEEPHFAPPSGIGTEKFASSTACQ